MSLLGMKGGTGIGTDPRFLGSIWTQIWTWLDSNPVIGSYGVEIFTKYAGILFTYYITPLVGGAITLLFFNFLFFGDLHLSVVEV